VFVLDEPFQPNLIFVGLAQTSQVECLRVFRVYTPSLLGRKKVRGKRSSLLWFVDEDKGENVYDISSSMAGHKFLKLKTLSSMKRIISTNFFPFLGSI
jgi:hypothetical protein